MKKRIKHPRLPSGFGTIRYLGEKRSRPYQVRAAASMDGDQVIPGEVLAYTEDWYKGFALLTAYNAHTWHPGDDIDKSFTIDAGSLEEVVRRLLDDYRHITGKAFEAIRANTFGDIAEAWYKDKYERTEKRVFAEGTKRRMRIGISTLSSLSERPISTLRLSDLQQAIDAIDKPTMQTLALTTLHGIYKYALIHEIVEKDYSIGIRVDSHESKHGQPFTPKEIKKLWRMRSDPCAEMLLIMIYSGFRIAAYEDMTVDLDKRFFQGGIKTPSSKNRIVPIHPCIYQLVQQRLARDGYLIRGNHYYGTILSAWCRAHGMNHTAHHCRHTFSALCEKYGVSENDRKRMLGHAFNDITNGVYGHRTLEDLRAEIEKIPPVDSL
jgi:integrase